jgi:hypothetical protein
MINVDGLFAPLDFLHEKAYLHAMAGASHVITASRIDVTIPTVFCL